MAVIRIQCPTCNSELEIDERHLGQEAECGNCLQIFVAEKEKKPYRMRRASEDEDDRPRRRRRNEDDDEENEDDRPRRRTRRDDDRPRRAETGNPAAVAALVLGILSVPLVCCCGVLALPVQIAGVITGSIGMKKAEGKGMALTGLVLSLVAMILTITLVALGVGLNLANMNNPGRFKRGP